MGDGRGLSGKNTERDVQLTGGGEAQYLTWNQVPETGK